MSESGNAEKVAAWPPEPGPGSLAETALEMRLSEDETRLARDEALIAADEARLLRDEQRLAADERATHLARHLSVISVALAVVLAIAVTGLVLGVIALRGDVDAITNAAPDESVGTSAIQDAAVTADKLADGSVTAGKVRRDSLTGADVRESTLSTVPSARVSRRARSATDATRLGGSPPWAYLSRIETIDASSATDARATKGPLVARCPTWMRVISGGAVVEGAVRGVAIVRSAPDGPGAWSAVAQGQRSSTTPWRLVVSAVCATGGR
jgi:hypothetical protein